MLADIASRVRFAYDALRGERLYRPHALTEAAITFDDLKQYLLDNPNANPWDIYKASFNRKTAIEYSTLSRCVTLIAGLGATMFVNATRVVDENGRRQTDQKSMRVLELMRESVDGVRPAWQFWEDVITDYCLEGNALVRVNKRLDGLPTSYQRLRPAGAECTQMVRSKRFVYRASEADTVKTTVLKLDESEVIHGRWGQMLANSNNERFLFAASPITLLRPAIEAGIQADKYILRWYRLANRGGHTHINYTSQRGGAGLQTQMNKTKRKEIAQEIKSQLITGDPLVSYDGAAEQLTEGPGEGSSQDVREFQTREVARHYGVPSPIVGADVTRWGGSLEPLARLMYRFGFRQHLERMMAPFGFRSLRKGHRFEFDANELLRGDSEGQLNIVRAIVGDAQRRPIGTLEEARLAIGLPTDYEGDLLEPLTASVTDPAGGEGAVP